jgi:hypothetical protein
MQRAVAIGHAPDRRGGADGDVGLRGFHHGGPITAAFVQAICRRTTATPAHILS